MNAKSRTSLRTTRFIVSVFGTLLLAAAPARAASVSYFLDQSNTLPDGTPYLQVTISDGIDGAIDFTVEVLDSLASTAGSNFGIQSFAFNVAGGDAGAVNIGNLPDGWTWTGRDQNRMSEFGFYDVQLSGTGQSRLDTLTFSILGIDGDTPQDYAVSSTGNVPRSNGFFAAHVADFKLADGCSPRNCAGSAFFSGSSPVPLPGAAWLFGAGVAAAALRARRRKTTVKTTV